MSVDTRARCEVEHTSSCLTCRLCCMQSTGKDMGSIHSMHISIVSATHSISFITGDTTSSQPKMFWRNPACRDHRVAWLMFGKEVVSMQQLRTRQRAAAARGWSHLRAACCLRCAPPVPPVSAAPRALVQCPCIPMARDTQFTADAWATQPGAWALTGHAKAACSCPQRN